MKKYKTQHLWGEYIKLGRAGGLSDEKIVRFIVHIERLWQRRDQQLQENSGNLNVWRKRMKVISQSKRDFRNF